MPRTTHPREVFRERTIRFVTTIAVMTFTLMAIIQNRFLFNIDSLIWYVCIYGVASMIYFFLHRRQIRQAAYALSFSVILLVIDPTAAYWAPGTVTFTIMFSLLFQIIHDRQRDIVIAVAINLLLYTWIALRSSPSPLDAGDYFSSTGTALFVMVAITAMLFGIASSIRREQYQRDQVELELERHKADILRQFLGSASHDLRTILSRIRLKSYFLRRIHPTPDADQHLVALQKGIDQLEQSLLAMIEMSQLDDQSQFEPETVVINEVLHKAIQQHAARAAARAIQLTAHLPDDPIRVCADPQLIGRALDNVIQNALDYTGEGGQVTIELTRRDQHVWIAVRDSGIGIAAADLPHIFERFYRADVARGNPDGRVGLGLAIARKIIDLHRGEIEVESTLGQGSTFNLQLPAPTGRCC